MHGPAGSPPGDAPQALLGYYDNELRPRRRQIRRSDWVLALTYAFVVVVNTLGALIVDGWWRWACLLIAIGMALALRAHVRQMRATARVWREFEARTEEFRRKVREAHEHDAPGSGG